MNFISLLFKQDIPVWWVKSTQKKNFVVWGESTSLISLFILVSCVHKANQFKVGLKYYLE